MKARFAAVGFALLSLCATQARAEVLDMSTLKCSDTANWSEDEAALVMFWLHGYYGGKADDTRVDFEAITAVAKQLAEACAANPDVGVMSALKSVVGG
nr:HdeA/HdeB family chaperone [uncultured Gellertiella sp.]